jgi:hypothetical protein
VRKFKAETNQQQNGRWIQLDSLASSSSGILLRIGNVTVDVQAGLIPGF